MPEPMTAREYQRLLCPQCGERKPPEQPLCSSCRRQKQNAQDSCPGCGRSKPAHYQLCAQCQIDKLMACPQCGKHKGHPERKLCPACYAQRKQGEMAACPCPCNCGKVKTKPKAPVCGLCWQAGHYHQPPEMPRESENDFAPI